MGRKRYTKEQKMKVALDAIRGDRTINEIASDYNVAPSLIYRWKDAVEGSADVVFGGGSTQEKRKAREMQEKYDAMCMELGKAQLEISLLKKALSMS